MAKTLHGQCGQRCAIWLRHRSDHARAGLNSMSPIEYLKGRHFANPEILLVFRRAQSGPCLQPAIAAESELQILWGRRIGDLVQIDREHVAYRGPIILSFS